MSRLGSAACVCSILSRRLPHSKEGREDQQADRTDDRIRNPQRGRLAWGGWGDGREGRASGGGASGGEGRGMDGGQGGRGEGQGGRGRGNGG